MELTSYDDPVKNTIRQIHEQGYTFGSIIPEGFFLKHFRITPAKTAEEQKENQMLYANYLGKVRDRLLNEFKFALRTKSGVGQEIVVPSEQTAWATTECKNELAKIIRKTHDRLTNIDMSALSDIEKKENSDAIAKLSFFSNRKIKQLGW